MVCDLCHKQVATVHLTEVIGDKIMELHICQECAQEKTNELKQQLSISDFLSSLVQDESNIHKKDAHLKCSFCGTTLYDFKKKGRLGCSQCYTSFKTHIIPLIKKIHSSTHHKGKLPRTLPEAVIISRRLLSLKDRLARAIQLEEYEEAAQLRDKIRQLEKKKRK